MTLTSFVCPRGSHLWHHQLQLWTFQTIPYIQHSWQCPALSHPALKGHTPCQWAAHLQQCLSHLLSGALGTHRLQLCSSAHSGAMCTRTLQWGSECLRAPTCALLGHIWSLTVPNCSFLPGFCLLVSFVSIGWFVHLDGWVFRVYFVGVGPLGFCKHFISVFSLWKFWSVKESCVKTLNLFIKSIFHFLSWLWSTDSFATYQFSFLPLPFPTLGELQKTCCGESLEKRSTYCQSNHTDHNKSPFFPHSFK